MQRRLFFFACFFIPIAIGSAGAFAQQYPFVHYSPNDGLVSNQVRSIYQDSRGRIYFVTLNGLSVFDGARFTNYTSEDGLHSDIINCVMEMGDDSLWVATNTNAINYIVNGKIKTLALKNPVTPIVNQLCRTESGNLYAAADEGLFEFNQNGFTKLPFSDLSGQDCSNYIASIVPAGNYLLCLRDPHLGGRYTLYLYDCLQKKIVSQAFDPKIIGLARANDGRLWISTFKGVMALDTAALLNGMIKLKELPVTFRDFSVKKGLIFFDAAGNCWLTEGNYSVIQCDLGGKLTVYTAASGLSNVSVEFIFQDKEGTIWLASNGGGVDKLMHTNLSILKKPFGLLSFSSIFLSPSRQEVLLYSNPDEKVIRFSENRALAIYQIHGAAEMHQFVESPTATYGIGNKKVFKLRKKGSDWYPELIFTETSQNNLGQAIVDRHGNLVLSGDNYLTVLAGEEIFQTPIHYLSDQVAEDNNGNIMIATRMNELIVYSTHPGSSSAYLKQQAKYTNEIADLSPRSITTDGDHNIWIGTRYKGIYVFKQQNNKLDLVFHLTSKNGLSENFVSYLAHDDDYTIWACTPSGLDKINIQNNKPVIENLTRQNNIYQNVIKVVIDNHKTAWAVTPEGLIKIIPEKTINYNYTPRLMLTNVLTGPDTLEKAGTRVFSYKQNNISFYFAAPSFLDEKQILYSYLLQGSNNQKWSDPSDNSSVSFAELKPGNYTLNIKAIFPAGRYPEQTLSYTFSVSPPWWQTWWFRTGIGILGIGFIVAIIRLYYLGKLERQKTILEKLQAIEKERTRIATDMHDDLGAGLSRIKFLSETIGIKKQKQEPIEDEITSIRNYSHDMIDKMGEIVWALNEKNDSLIDLMAYTRAYAVEYLTQNGIRVTVQTTEEFPPTFVTGEFRRNIYLAVKEALHNIVKHAGAEHVFITFDVKQELHITIKDDGCGFKTNNNKPYSNGLINMRKRMKDLGGSFEIKNLDGTQIHFSAPLSVSPSQKEEKGLG